MTYLKRLYELEKQALATFEYYKAKYQECDDYDVAYAEAFHDLLEIQDRISFAEQDELDLD